MLGLPRMLEGVPPLGLKTRIMLFEVDFLCLDARPLRKKNKGLVDFLEPLHQRNETIKRTTAKNHISYYRNMGILNTGKKVKPAFFKTRNSIKFAGFEKHQLNFKSEKYDLSRGNHVRRYFSTDVYGVINRLKLGFEFSLKPKEGKANRSIDESRNTFEFIKFVLEEIQVKTKNGKERPLWKLGKEWMPGIIADSTRHKAFSQKNDPKNVTYKETTVVITYEDNELLDLPRAKEEFRVDNCPENVKIFYYDYDAFPDHIRIYMIQHEHTCPQDFLHELKARLLNLKTNFACLEYALCEVNELNDTFKKFVGHLVADIYRVSDNKRYGFLNLGDQDEGEICKSDTRRKINDRLKKFPPDIIAI